MLEQLVDTAIANLLSASVPGLSVTVGMADNEPELQTPCAAVFSVVEEVQGRVPLTRLKTTVEYYSISGQDAAADVAAVITEIDTALTSPSPSIVAALPPTGLNFLAWEHIPRTANEIGDRRRSIRELTVLAS